MHQQTSWPREAAPLGSSIGLQLFGSFRLTIDSVAVDLSPARQRLVALLAIMGRMSRNRACALLWPDMDEERARHNLRSSIWRTTAAADGLLACTHAAVGLAGKVDVDVHRFTRAAQELTRSSAELPADPGYESDLLPDWDDDWLDVPRERLRMLRLHVLERNAEALNRVGEHGLALDQALAAVHADPLRESAHRIVIGIHLAAGNRVQARDALDTCRQILAQDAGVEPSPATLMLLDAPLPSAR